MGEQVAVNMLDMGECFVGEVRDARETTGKQSEEREPGGIVEFQAQVREHGASEKVNRVQEWQALSNQLLVDRLVKDNPILLILTL